jgi:hypothetical protein
MKEAYMEWQTKSIASFISLTAQSAEARKQMLAMVQTLALRPDKTAPDDTPVEPSVGSFEALAGIFGPR